MEIWKDVKDYEGFYQISNLGNVKSLDRVIQKYNNIERRITDFKIKGKLLKPKTRKDGYKVLYFQLDGVRKEFYVHHLVIMNFIGERPKGYHICHGDGNRSNNNLDNLRYATPKENTFDSVKHGTCYFKLGSKNPFAKLKESDIAYIIKNIGIKTQVQLAEMFNVTRQAISSVQRRKNWGFLNET
jgi:hypothetical protein